MQKCSFSMIIMIIIQIFTKILIKQKWKCIFSTKNPISCSGFTFIRDSVALRPTVYILTLNSQFFAPSALNTLGGGGGAITGNGRFFILRSQEREEQAECFILSSPLLLLLLQSYPPNKHVAFPTGSLTITITGPGVLFTGSSFHFYYKITFWSQFVQKHEILSSSTAWGLRPETHHEGLSIWEIIGKSHFKTGTFFKALFEVAIRKASLYWTLQRILNEL